MVELSPPLLPDLDTETSWVRRRLGLIAGALVIVAGVAAGYWFFLRDDSKPAPVAQQQTATATTGSIVSELSTTGTAQSSLSSKLTFASSAKVTAVNAKLGDKVQQGQVLATLDSSDAASKLQAARVALTAAQSSYSDLVQPPTASALASAQASISTAQYQLANAQDALHKGQGNPSPDDVTAADSAITQAQQGITSAQSQSQTAWISLLNAQRTYCGTDNHLVQACLQGDIPLTPAKIDALIAEIRSPATSAVGTAAQGLISANTGYANSLSSITTAQTALKTAQDKKTALYAPATGLALQQLQSAVDSASANVLAAQQKYADLLKGPTASQVAQAQQSVSNAQSAVESAQTAYDSVVLTAPFAGTVTAVGVNVGDQVSPTTAAFTITNTDAIRVDLSVQEADYVGLKAGQYGIATFDALTGNTYVIRITAVNPTPTTTQGVVSYQVQTEILRADQLSDPATQQAVIQTLGAANGGALRGRGTAGTGAAANRTPAASGTSRAAGANGTAQPNGQNRGNGAGANGTPRAGGPGANGGFGQNGANVTPGANQQGGAPGGQGAAGGAAFLQNLLNQPMPTPGMNATVVIIKSVTPDLLLVPTSAIKTQGGQKTVTVKKDDGTTEVRTVTTGASDSTNTAITNGLTAGEVVLTGTTTSAATGATANRTTTTNQQGFPGGGFAGGGNFGPAGGGGNTNSATGGVR